MHLVSGLEVEQDFASHGADLFEAAEEALGQSLASFPRILDFGCGSGRLARLLRGHPGEVHGCDLDPRLVRWTGAHLDFLQVRLSPPQPPLPYPEGCFDLILGVSVFSHLPEEDQDAFLADLARCLAPGGRLLLSVHGERALERARTEPRILTLLGVSSPDLEQVEQLTAGGRHGFVLQDGHLTHSGSWRDTWRYWWRGEKAIAARHRYGIAFHPSGYLGEHWTRVSGLELLVHRVGGVHDFQDVVVLGRSALSR